MTPLGILLFIKIAVTIVLWAGPLLVISKGRLLRKLKVSEPLLPIFRLYGVAMAALVVGYATAFWPISQGVFPWGIVTMGLVSNGGAVIALLLTGTAHYQKLSTSLLFVFTLGLAGCALVPSWALSPLGQ